MKRWLFYRRFTFVDSVVVSVAASQVGQQNWVAALVIIVVGIFLSGLLEEIFNAD